MGERKIRIGKEELQTYERKKEERFLEGGVQ